MSNVIFVQQQKRQYNTTQNQKTSYTSGFKAASIATNDRHLLSAFHSRHSSSAGIMSGLLYAVQLFVFFAINLSLKGTPRTVLDLT